MPINHRIAKVVTLTCPNCGTPFQRLERHAKNKEGKQYCGRPCYSAARKTDLSPRFWSSVDKTGPCWLWNGTLNAGGYGVISVRRDKARPRGVVAHRVSWEMINGPIPEGMNVCHHCDVRNCVRPDHLFLGTDDDNMRDMVQKHRSMFGVKNCNAKANEQMVREIRSRFRPHTKGLVRQMAKDYGIDRTAIYHIIWRKTWKHVM